MGASYKEAYFFHAKEDPIKQQNYESVSSEVCKQRLKDGGNGAGCSLMLSFAL